MVTDMWRFIVVAFILLNYKLVRANSSEADVGTRVVNGTDAKDGEFPFIVRHNSTLFRYFLANFNAFS